MRCGGEPGFVETAVRNTMYYVEVRGSAKKRFSKTFGMEYAAAGMCNAAHGEEYGLRCKAFQIKPLKTRNPEVTQCCRGYFRFSGIDGSISSLKYSLANSSCLFYTLPPICQASFNTGPCAAIPSILPDFARLPAENANRNGRCKTRATPIGKETSPPPHPHPRTAARRAGAMTRQSFIAYPAVSLAKHAGLCYSFKKNKCLQRM